MSSTSGVRPPKSGDDVTIPFRPKTQRNEQFFALFKEGMTLVEETANYLDGPGRRQSKTLTPFVSLAYATESMRLTTRLTQLATWLLARRAVINGEPLPPAGSVHDPLLLPPIARSSQTKGYEELPSQLKQLIDASFDLHEKIYRYDAIQRGEIKPSDDKPNPVAKQFAQLHAAFSGSM